MEGGNPFIEYVTYGIAALIILGMIALLIRTLTLVIGFLSLTMADTWHRWRPTREEKPQVEEKPPVSPD